MFEEVGVLTHSSIKISGSQILYFDPYGIKEESHDADIIFVTHDHFDHFSPEDIQKAAKEDTWLIMPANMQGKGDKFGANKCKFLNPDGVIEAKGLMVKAIPTHYGTVAGSPEDGKKFAELVDKKIEVRVMM